MITSTTTNVFQGIGKTFDNWLQFFVIDTSSNLIKEITPWAIGFTTVYIILYGYMILLGKIQEPASDFITKSAKIILIGGLALKTDLYLEWVVGFFQGIEESLTQAFSQSDTGSSIYASLDNSLSKGLDIVLQCRQKATSAGWGSFSVAFSWWLIATLIMIGFGLVVCVGGISVMMSTVMLKLAFAIGPLFVLCAMWPVTAKFFDSWVGFLLNHILIVALTTVVMVLAINVYGVELQKINFDSDQNMLFVSLELLIVAGILYAVVRSILPMAAALAGGFTMAVLGISHLARYGSLGAKAAKGAGKAGLAAGKGLYKAGRWAAGRMGRRNSISNTN